MVWWTNLILFLQKGNCFSFHRHNVKNKHNCYVCIFEVVDVIVTKLIHFVILHLAFLLQFSDFTIGLINMNAFMLM